MACAHGRRRGHCRICELEELERYYGVPEDHIDSKEGDDDS